MIRLLDLGYDDAAICEHLSIYDPRTLDKLKAEILETLTPAYLDAVDRFRARNYQRYERLYRVAEAVALGIPLPERQIKNIMEDVVQKDWMKIALGILDAEARLMEYDLERAAKRSEEEDSNTAFIDLQNATLNLSSDLAKAGSELIKTEWGDGELLDYIYERQETPLPPPPPTDDPEQLLEDLDPREIHEQLRGLQARLHRSQLTEDVPDGD